MKKKTLLERQGSTIKVALGIFFMLIFLNSVSALEMMNTKSYDSDSKTVHVQSTFLWLFPTGKVADIQLDTPIVYNVMMGKNRLVAQLTFNSYENYTEGVLDNLEMIDVKTGREIERNFTYKYRITEKRDVPEYKESCTELKNGSKSCEFKQNGSHKEEVYTWEELPLLKKFTKGNITIGIFTDVLPKDNIEWIPTLYGLRITEWATWVESLSQNMIAYYNFNESSGNTTDIYTGMHNSTANTGANYSVTGKSNNAYQFGGSHVVKFDTAPSAFDMNNGTNFTISFWINTTNTGVEYYLGNCKDDSTAQYLIGKRASASGDYLEMIYDGQEPISDLAVPLGVWTHIVVLKRDTNLTFYVNGIAWSVAATENLEIPAGGTYFKVGGYGGAGQGLLGFFDELAVWNRSLSGSEIATLYDSGTGTFYTGIIPDNPPTATLTAPMNYYNSSSSSVNFNCSASDDKKIQNVSLWINGTRNYTLSDGVNNFTELYKALSMGDGKYNWTCSAEDNATAVQVGWAANRSLTIDTIFPDIKIIYPIAFNYSDNKIDINYTVSDVNLASCWYSNDSYSANTSITCGQNITSIVWTEGQHNATVWANDSAGNLNSSSVSFGVDTIKPDILILYPSNNSNSSNVNLNVNYTVSDANLVSCWYSNDSMSKNTTLASCVNITSVVWAEGSHNVTVWANDSAGSENYSSVTFKVDSIAPVVNITSPLSVDYHKKSNNLTITWNVSDLSLDSCIGSYNNGLSNITLVCGNNNITLNVTSTLNNSFMLWANDTFGNSAITTRTWSYKVFQDNIAYSAETTEGATEKFLLNFTTGLTPTDITLVYNSTGYASAYSVSSGEVSVSNSIAIPVQDTNLMIPFYWSLLFTDGSRINTTTYNQSVKNLQIDDCTAYPNLIYNFTLVDEESQAKLANTTIDIQINWYDSGRTVKIMNFSKSYTANPATVCVNNTLLTSVNYSVDSVVKYTSNNSGSSYAIEYYNILNQIITNTTVPKHITLFDLLSSKSTEFQLTFRDSNFAYAANALVYVYRQYVADNDYQVVEVPLTDSNGQTVLHLVRNDAVYNFVMVDEDGNILATFNKVIAFCQDYTIGSCSINLNARSGGDSFYDYTDDLGISYTNPVYSNATKLISFSFTSSNLSSVTVSMEAIRNNQFGNRSVCSSSLTSATGTLTCNVSAITGSDRFLFVNIYVGGELKAQKVIDLEESKSGFGIVNGAFYAFLLMLFIVLMFMEDKQILIVAMIIGWAVIVALGLISGLVIGSLSGGIWLIVCAVIFLWKLKKEETG